MIELSQLQVLSGEWLSGGGAEADVVVSSRVRLARNVAGFPFLTRAAEEKRAAVEGLIRAAVKDSSLRSRMTYHDLAAMEHVERQFLVERHLISRDHAFAQGPRGVAFTADERVSIMVNEEDHLRIQSLRAGLELRAAFELANEIDDALEERVDYAYSSQFGYLTACPTNLGTGMRVSVMLHLPALVITREIEKVFQAVNKINLAVRGLYGEGTQASGDFYQISNQVTLGKTEDEIADNLVSVIPQIVKYERKVRQTLLQAKRVILEDKIWRALGVLRVARTITSEETLELLSLVRLGVHLTVVEGISTSTLNELLVLSQPAHLQKVESAKLSSHERDVVRARYIRERLGKDMGPVG